jgi:hypothetical protein
MLQLKMHRQQVARKFQTVKLIESAGSGLVLVTTLMSLNRYLSKDIGGSKDKAKISMMLISYGQLGKDNSTSVIFKI